MLYLLLYLPITLLIALKMYNKLTNNTKKYQKHKKDIKANKIAQKRLKNAKKCIKKEDFDSFFEEIEKSLWGYFSDKFKVNTAELSKETIITYFNAVNINKIIEKQFIDLLNECEFSRYTPETNRNTQMEKTLNKAKAIIISVEKSLK